MTTVPLLQRQLLRELFHLFVLILCVLLTLILISRAVQMRDLFLGLDLGLVDTVLLFSFMSPVFLMLIIPVSCMLSAFLTILRMSTDRELVALKAGGVSIYQLLPIPLLFSVLCMGLTLWVSMHWLAWGMGHFRETILEVATTRARIVVQPGVFNTDFPNVVLYARKVDPASGEMQQVLVDDKSQAERKLVILAPVGRITTDTEKGDLVFQLENGQIYSTTKQASSLLQFDNYQVRLPLTSMLKSVDLGEIRPKEMSWSRLNSSEVTEKLLNNKEFANSVSVELHKRWAYPMACIALTLFVLPLAAAFEGVHRQTGIAIALVMFFVYYGLMSMGMSMGETGTLPPIVGLWAPNMLFLIAGSIGIYLTGREHVPQFSQMLNHFFHTLRRLRKKQEELA